MLCFAACLKNYYHGSGKLLAISLCNGGGVGNCLSRAVYEFIAYGEEIANPKITDVVDAEVKEMLQTVMLETILLYTQPSVKIFCQ